MAKEIFDVFGAENGVGKTLLSVNLANSIKHENPSARIAVVACSGLAGLSGLSNFRGASIKNRVRLGFDVFVDDSLPEFNPGNYDFIIFDHDSSSKTPLHGGLGLIAFSLTPEGLRKGIDLKAKVEAAGAAAKLVACQVESFGVLDPNSGFPQTEEFKKILKDALSGNGSEIVGCVPKSARHFRSLMDGDLCRSFAGKGAPHPDFLNIYRKVGGQARAVTDQTELQAAVVAAADTARSERRAAMGNYRRPEIHKRIVAMHEDWSDFANESFSDEAEAFAWIEETMMNDEPRKDRGRLEEQIICEERDFVWENGDYVSYEPEPAVSRIGKAGSVVLVELCGARELTFARENGDWQDPADLDSAAAAVGNQSFESFRRAALPVLDQALADFEADGRLKAARQADGAETRGNANGGPSGSRGRPSSRRL